MSQFGKWGRWSNQLLEYAFLKTYAKQHNCELQLPPWVGNVLLAADDPPVTVELPPRLEQTNHLEQAQPPTGDEYVNHDFRGFSQYHTSYYRPWRKEIAKFWSPARLVAERMVYPVMHLTKHGSLPRRTVVGIHLRRGDYGRLIFYVTPVQWYLEWLAVHWDSLDDPVLFVASESPELVEDFRQYNPVTAETLGVELSSEPLEHYAYLAPDLQSREPLQMEFFVDWYLLSWCNVILAPNSTYSFTAAMGISRLQQFWRSDLKQEKFVQLDPWDAYPLTHDKAEDFRHVPGVCLEETAYWRRLPDGSFEEKG
jgi:hypothetical protein